MVINEATYRWRFDVEITTNRLGPDIRFRYMVCCARRPARQFTFLKLASFLFIIHYKPQVYCWFTRFLPERSCTLPIFESNIRFVPFFLQELRNPVDYLEVPSLTKYLTP